MTTPLRRNLHDFWSDIETRWLAGRLPDDVDRPLFVCGLARAGTTVVTELLHQHPDTGSLLYRDLPFVRVPYFWQFVSPLYYGKREPKQRLHGDALNVHLEAPDAFEETVWMHHLKDYDKQGFCRVRDESYDNEALEHHWRSLIRKVLYVREANRYLAKGNYNLFRLRYMLKLFPEARIIICVRDPHQHAQSLARVHRRFTKIAASDPTFAKQLDQLGHFEFGPHRRAICLPGGHWQQTLEHWKQGEDYEGYLLQWQDVYQLAYDAYGDHPHIFWLNSESLRQHPKATLEQMWHFSELSRDAVSLKALASSVKRQNQYTYPETPYDAEVERLYASLMGL